MDYLAEAEGEIGSTTPSLFGEATHLTTRSGLSVYVRHVEACDVPALEEFFTNVTSDDLRFRFLSSLSRLSSEQVLFLANMDDATSENFLAFDLVTGCVLGSAVLAMDDNREEAEVAIVIRSSHKSRGLGWSMLDDMSQRAAGLGVKTLRSLESRENSSAIMLERELGFTIRSCPNDPDTMILKKSLLPSAPNYEAATT